MNSHDVARSLVTCTHPYDDVEHDFYVIRYTNAKRTPYAVPVLKCRRCGATLEKGGSWSRSMLVHDLHAAINLESKPK